MIVTGIAHPPQWLYERDQVPSSELVFLAKKALNTYAVTHLISSLEPGWEQALAKAAIEMDIAFTIALPYPDRDATWKPTLSRFYRDLMAHGVDIYQISDFCQESAMLETHCWRVDHSDTVLALWDYEFEGHTYETMSYALQNNKRVVNLWQDWHALYSIRRHPAVVVPKQDPLPARGAQIYEHRRQ